MLTHIFYSNLITISVKSHRIPILDIPFRRLNLKIVNLSHSPASLDPAAANRRSPAEKRSQISMVLNFFSFSRSVI